MVSNSGGESLAGSAAWYGTGAGCKRRSLMIVEEEEDGPGASSGKSTSLESAYGVACRAAAFARVLGALPDV